MLPLNLSPSGGGGGGGGGGRGGRGRGGGGAPPAYVLFFPTIVAISPHARKPPKSPERALVGQQLFSFQSPAVH